MAGGVWQQQQQSVPDAPAPQPATNLDNLKQQVAPGKGTAPGQQPGQNPNAPAAPEPPSAAGNGAAPPDQTGDNAQQQTPPVIPPPGQASSYSLVVQVNYVDVPVTVLDKKGQPVPGLTWRQFRVYEDGVRQDIRFFTTDPYPLSVAFVIDQTLPSDIMRKVNDSLNAVTAGLSPADSVAVVTYGGAAPELVTDFTAANSARLPAAFQRAKRSGQAMGVPTVSGPMAEGPMINGQQVDPNLAPQRGNSGGFLVQPREAHPLNDAILYAANLLSKQPRGRKRVIYVISDGKEARSKASYREVVRYLLTNNIGVYGTLVGDAATWGIGYLDKVHLPLLPPEDLLPKYSVATGGEVQAQFSEDGIQKSFARITDSVRGQYTLGYISHTSTLAAKFHSIDVRVEGIPNLTILAKAGYYPSASMR